jgi:hypothetical protein
MYRRKLLLLALLLGLLAGPVLAEEVIYFTNGTSMPIRTHTVEGDMITVDLGANATMAFPMHMVERVEQAGSEVWSPTAPAGRNKMVQGKEPSHVTRGTWASPAAEQRRPENDQVTVNNKGMAGFHPLPEDSHPKKREARATGSTAVLGVDPARTPQEGMLGTRRMGTRSVFPTPASSSRRNIMSLQKRGAPAQPDPEPAEAQEGQEAETGDD